MKETNLSQLSKHLTQHHWVKCCEIRQFPHLQQTIALIELNSQGIAFFREKGKYTLIATLKQSLSDASFTSNLLDKWYFVEQLPERFEIQNTNASVTIPFLEKKAVDWNTIYQTTHEAHYQVKVPIDLVYFDGHFANFPLVPGVVELQWVLDKATEWLGKSLSILRIDNLKFQKFVRPNDEIEMALYWEQTKQRIKFQLKTNNESCTSGIIILDLGDEIT